MTEKRLLESLVLTLLIVGCFHTIAVFFFLYWSYWWIDIPMHFLGGVFAGQLALWFYFFGRVRGAHIHPTRTSILLVSTLGALFIGLLWELFEYVTGLTFTMFISYQLDTIKDLTNDVAGGLCAGYYWISMNRK